MTDEIKNSTNQKVDDIKEPEVDNFVDEIKEEKNDNPLGLEELPEEIKKKMEKRKAEKDQQKSKRNVKRKKKKAPRKITIGKAFIRATYNNTIVTLTDMQGNVIAWASAGIAGFRGPKKSEYY